MKLRGGENASFEREGEWVGAWGKTMATKTDEFSEKFQSLRPPLNGSVLGGRLFSVEVAGRVVAAVGGRASI